MRERRAYASVSIIKSCVITGGVTGRDEGCVPRPRNRTERSWIIGKLGDMLILFRIRNARPRNPHYQCALTFERDSRGFKCRSNIDYVTSVKWISIKYLTLNIIIQISKFIKHLTLNERAFKFQYLLKNCNYIFNIGCIIKSKIYQHI